jgi:hypothetical protein
MTKFISTAVFSILLFGILVLSAINYHNNNVLESRINTALKFSCDIESEKSFKEDYYILQQAHDTNLIIFIFGALVAVIGFFTYQNVVAKFELKTTEFDNAIIEQKTVMYEELSNIKLNSAKDMTNLVFEMADDYFKKRDTVNYLHYTLWGLSKFTDLILWTYDKYRHEEDATEVLSDLNKVIVKKLLIVNRRIGTELQVKEPTLDEVEENIEYIRRVNDKEVNKILSQIQAKLKKI